MRISKEDIFRAIDNPDSLSDSEKKAINKQMKRNHFRARLKTRIALVGKWLWNNWLSLLALLIAILSYIAQLKQ